MSTATKLLGGLDPAEFLERYWQKTPLLVRGALPGLERLLSPGELAGLAGDAGVASRIVLERGGEPAWEVRHGPFDDADFAALPAERWTLLVQEVDRLLPAVAEIVEPFRFLPNWRFDDVMVSYAAPGGSVGPHVDHYDVFLVQALAPRRWRLGAGPLAEERILPGLELRVLERFAAERELVLEPGDLLYLPPRWAHHGVACEPCMTFSIGFHAPSRRELAAWLLEWTLEALPSDDRYADPGCEPAADPGEFSAATLERVRRMLARLLDDEAALLSWFGPAATRPRREASQPWRGARPAARQLREELVAGALLRRDAIPRFAHRGGRLFVGGRERALDRDLHWAAPLLCGTQVLDRRALGGHLDDARFVELLAELVSEGFLVVERPDGRHGSRRTYSM